MWLKKNTQKKNSSHKDWNTPAAGASRWCYSAGEGHTAEDLAPSLSDLSPSSAPGGMWDCEVKTIHVNFLNMTARDKVICFRRNWQLDCLPWWLSRSASEDGSLLLASCTAPSHQEQYTAASWTAPASIKVEMCKNKRELKLSSRPFSKHLVLTKGKRNIWKCDLKKKTMSQLISQSFLLSAYNVPCHWWDSAESVVTAGRGVWPAFGASPQWCRPCPTDAQYQCAQVWWEWTEWPRGPWWTFWQIQIQFSRNSTPD